MTNEDFVLSPDEAVAVGETATAFASALPADRNAAYLDLAGAATSGSLGEEHVASLERVCVLALETGKARQLGSAETERLLTAVYRRTPGGRALTAETADVNKVLQHFAGRTLQSARISCRMPGRYQLDLTVDGIDVAISIEPEGLEVRSLQTG
ncbi:MAG: hypothetical protein ABI232_13220 [Jatrophihabitantaceae bacterium]